MPLRRLLALALSLASAAVAQQPTFPGFATTPSFSASNTATPAAQSALVADFNRDGKEDILTFGPGQVCLRPGNGDGTFALPVLSPSGVDAAVFASAVDLNGDGYPDVVAGDGWGPTVGVLLNHKDGTFTSVNLPPSGIQSPGYPAAAVVGKTTQSGAADIVVLGTGSARGQSIALTYLNDGSGHFAQVKTSVFQTPLGSKIAPISPVLADINHDGKLDLVFANPLLDIAGWDTTNVEIHLGNGDGTFGPVVPPNGILFFPDSPANQAASIVIASLTGDPNRQDILFSSAQQTYIALANGDGTYGKPKLALPQQPLQPNLAPPADYTYFNERVQVADINGDGKPDLVLSQRSGFAAFAGNGDGTFGQQISTAMLTDSAGPANKDFPQPQIVFADFNGDNRLDFVSADRSSGFLSIGLAESSGGFAAPTLFSSTGTPVFFPLDFDAGVAFDLNNDGATDVLGIDLGSRWLIAALSTGKGGFQYKQALPATVGVADLYAASAPFGSAGGPDFNNDGKADLILHLSGAAYGVALGNGDGTFQTPRFLGLPQQISCTITPFTTGDINGDGKLDIVAGYLGDYSCGTTGNVFGYPSGYFTLLGKGDGTFQTATFVKATQGSINGVVLAPFHGSKAPLDLIVSESEHPFTTQPTPGLNTETVSLLSGKGDGTFNPPTVIDTGHFITKLLTADADGDGFPDLTLLAQAVPNGPSGGLFLYTGKGGGTFTNPLNILPNRFIADAAYVDLNGDRLPDLLVTSNQIPPFTVSSGFSILLGTGNGAFASPIDTTAPEIALLLPGNFLGDNAPSVIAAGTFSASLLPNLGGSSLTLSTSAASAPAGRPVTLTATLSPTLPNRPTPSGTVTFYEGATAIGTANAPNAALTLSSLPQGTHTVTARYSGDPDFLPNASAPITLTVTAAPPVTPDFTLTAAAPGITVARGSSGTLKLALTANAAFSGPVTFSCSGLPAGAACAISPVTLAAGQTAAATLTLSTTGSATASTRLEAARRAALLAGTLLLGFSRSRRLAPLLRTRTALGLLLMVGLASALMGCGGGSPKPPNPPTGGTPAGSSMVTVTAASGAVTHAAVFTLTVQ